MGRRAAIHWGVGGTPADATAAPERREDEDVERAALTISESLIDKAALAARLPPLSLVIALGLLSTPMILAWFWGMRSLWATLGSLVVVWVVCPLIVCTVWPHTRKLIHDEILRTCRNPGRQTAFAVLLGSCTVAMSLSAWHYFARPLGLPPATTRQQLSALGLDESEPWADIFLISWLTLVNPLMEEFFWRVFLMQLLLAYWNDSRFCSKPRHAMYVAAFTASTLYAAYHVPVIATVAPLSLALFAGVCLVMIGGLFQALAQAGFLIIAFGLHMCGDLVICMILADIVWTDFPLRERI